MRYKKQILSPPSQRFKRWTVIFPGADASVIKRSQSQLAANPELLASFGLGASTQAGTYMILEYTWVLFAFLVFGLLFSVLVR